MRAFIGLSVDWNLFFWSASYIGSEKERMLIFFWDGDENRIAGLVTCDVPTTGNERFPLMDRTDRFRVRGTIERASAIDIHLKDVKIEVFHDAS